MIFGNKMFILTLSFLIKTSINFYTLILLLRVLMQLVQCDFYNSFSQCIVRLTQPIVQKIQHFIPPRKNLDVASIFLSFILEVTKIFLLVSIEFKSFLINPISLLLFGLLGLIKSFGGMIFWIIIFHSILKWIHKGTAPEVTVIHKLSEPFISQIRRVIPIINEIDFSGVILILIIFFLNYLGLNFFPNIWYIL